MESSSSGCCMKDIDLSIIIVSYNTCNILVECISSIVKTVKKVQYEIIIIDNNSKDASVKVIDSLFVKRLKKYREENKNLFNVTLIVNKENSGFSKANNIGVKKSSGKYLLFLNPDTLVYERTIDGMMEFMEKETSCGASTCFVELTGGKLDDASHRGFPTPWRSFCYFSGLSKLFPNKIFSGYNLSYLSLNSSHQIDACAGSFMLVRREAGEKIKWWDEDFFWYGEDLDFCFRLKEKGWQIYFVPSFRVFHYKGVSGGIKKISKHLTVADNTIKNKAINSRFQAMEVFYKKHYLNKYPSFVTSMVFWGIRVKKYLSKA